MHEPTPLAAFMQELANGTCSYWYDHSRCYDPSQGRWLNQEPLGFEAGQDNMFP